MPLVNLIHEQRLEARARERKVQLGVISTMAIGALCVLATMALMLDATRMNMKASALEKKQAEMEPMLKELQANKTEIAKLQPRIKTLEEAVMFSGKWGLILDHLTTNMPPQTWLTNMKAFQNDPKKPMTLTLNGVSTSQEAVGELILRMQANPEFEAVNLNFTQPKFLQGEQQYEFEIAADLVKTAEETEEITEVTSS